MPTVSGKWKWNELVYCPDKNVSAAPDFVSNGIDMWGVSVWKTGSNFVIQYDDTSDGAHIVTVSGGDNPKATVEEYRIMDFGETEQEVSDEFYNYLVANAKSLSVSTTYFADIDTITAINYKTGEKAGVYRVENGESSYIHISTNDETTITKITSADVPVGKIMFLKYRLCNGYYPNGHFGVSVKYNHEGKTKLAVGTRAGGVPNTELVKRHRGWVIGRVNAQGALTAEGLWTSDNEIVQADSITIEIVHRDDLDIAYFVTDNYDNNIMPFVKTLGDEYYMHQKIEFGCYISDQWRKINEEQNGGITQYDPFMPPNLPEHPEEPEPVFYSVSFELNGRGTPIEPKIVLGGRKVSKPNDPIDKYYDFGGWYTNEQCTVEYNFNSAVNSNLTLYAKWVESIAIAKKLQLVAENTPKVYDAGYKKGKADTINNVIDNVEIIPDFSRGNMTESLPEGYSAKSATIIKPQNLIPENIAKDVDIAGVIGTHEGGGGSVEGTAKVTFCNYDGTELYSRLVFIGDDCNEPVAQNRIDTPTKASTAQYNYTFNGWSNTEGGSASSAALKNITADKTVYAAFSASPVYYTVRFYDGDTLMQESQVAYGETVTPPDTTKAGHSFIGWTINGSQTDNFVITEDIDYYGAWESYSGIEITDSWDDIIAACNDGTYKNKYNILDYKPLDCGTEGVVNMQIIAFDTDIKSDGRGTAPITWIAIELLQSTVSDYSIWYVSSGSGSGVLRKHYLENVLPKIPSNVRSAIVAVDKTYLDGTTKTSTSTISDTIWAPSMREWEAASRNETTGVEYPLWVRTVKRLNGVASKWALRSCWLNSYGGRDGVYVRDTASDLVGSGVLGVSVGVCLCFCT